MILAAAACVCLCVCVCVCVCEDLATILHAWCLYLASPSPSLPLFSSPYVDVSAGLCLCARPRLAEVLYFDFSPLLSPLFVFAHSAARQ